MNTPNTPKSILKFDLEGLSNEETHRWRESLHKILISGALNIRAGEAVLRFDKDGTLQQIDFSYIKYKRSRGEADDERFITVEKPLTIDSA